MTHGEMRNTDKILAGKPGRRRPLGDLGAERRIVLKWVLKIIL
jgi:hypothetical protein